MTEFHKRPDPVVRLIDDDRTVLDALGTYPVSYTHLTLPTKLVV